MGQTLDLRCALLSNPSTIGAGVPTKTHIEPCTKKNYIKNHIVFCRYDTMMAEGTPYQDNFGIGLWGGKGIGHFGGGEDWAWAALSIAPNPVQCRWKGPFMSDFNCSFCVLGYETSGADDSTCIKPGFRPYREWASLKSELKLQDTNGFVVEPDTSTNKTVILTGHTYTIPKPQLEPKERMFAGYKEPHTQIRYELDFIGADVDFGCGGAVVGNGAGDEQVRKDVYGHPTSMDPFSYHWPVGLGNLNAKTPDYGYHPERCPRYHRFKVISPGNFTFDTCSSSMFVGIQIYKRTDNLSQSEPRMTSDWDGFKHNQLFEVPLHDNDKQYATVSTGLIRVTSDVCGADLVEWMNSFHDKNDRIHEEMHCPSMNGCNVALRGAISLLFCNHSDMLHRG